MIYTFKLPDIGEGLAEGEISQWLVKENEEVKEDEGLVEIQNDKSVEEIPSPVTGIVKKIKVAAGETVPVGTALVDIETDTLPHAHEETEEESESTTVQEAEVPSEEKTTTVVEATPETNSSKQILAVPSVRRYAHENGVDLTKVTATGKKNHITKADVDNFLNNGSDTQTTQATTVTPKVEVQAGDIVTKMSGVRLATAKAMSNSKHTAPHVTLFDEVEVSKLWDHRKKYKAILAEDGVKLTFLPYIVKALTLTLKKFPTLNSSIDVEARTITEHQNYNIGIATDTDSGLYVPVIKNADTLGLKSIASKISENTQKAMERKLTADDMHGGTMTITNIGSIGGGYFTPVINVPEVAILGIGTITKQPIVNENDEIVVGKMMKLSLSFDHRIIDGALAQKAMNYLKMLLSDPELLLMEG